MTWPEVIAELIRIRSLADNWDGEGTNAPPKDLVDGAIRLATFLENWHAPPDRVIASVNATVYFEWRTPSGYKEFEAISPTMVEFRYVSSDLPNSPKIVRIT